MKEQEPTKENLTPIKSELTNQPQMPHTRGGDIFMAEPGNGEGNPQEGPKLPPPPIPIRIERGEGGEPPKRPPEGQPVSPTGEKPIERRVDRINPEDFAKDLNLERMVGEINQEIASKGGKAPDSAFIKAMGEDLRRRLTERSVDESLASRLEGILVGLAREAGRQEIAEKDGDILTEIKRKPARSLSGEEKDERKNRLAEILRGFSPHNATFPQELIQDILEYDELLDSFITRIVAQPLDAETSPYRLSFYGGINLEQIKDILKQEKEYERDSSLVSRRNKQYQKVILAEEAMNLLQSMNMQVVTGNLENFIRIAEGILPKHFMYWRDIQGVSEAMRTYEQEYQEYLRKYGRITSVEINELNKKVEDLLSTLNENGLMGKRRMETWELTRALNIGRTFFNITFRSSELIATGRVPTDRTPLKTLVEIWDILNDPQKVKEYEREVAEARKKGRKMRTVRELRGIINDPKKQGDYIKELESHKEEFAQAEKLGKEQYSSFPLETATRMMNWVQYMTYRFNIGQPRGGLEFLKQVKAHYFEFLQTKGVKLGKNRITDFGGTNVEEMEVGGMFFVTGIYSSWRLENQALTQMKITIDGNEITIRDWLAYKRLEIDRAKLKFKKADKKDGNKKTEAQRELVGILRPLIENTDIGLGILLKQPAFSEELGYEARKLLWEKIAEKNTPLMINYLGGLKLEEGADSIRSLEVILMARGIDDKSEAWNTFRNKILIRHERALKQAMGEKAQKLPEGQELTPDEEALLNDIAGEAKKLSPHLADIAFPYTPFMNDAPFEIFDYNVSGAEYYKRRTGADFPSYYEAEGAFVGLMDNPGGIGIEKGLEALAKIVKGIQGPQGAVDAQKAVFPMLETFFDWISTTPGKRWIIFKTIMEALRKPTSVAQEYAKGKAPSLNEFEMGQFLDEAVKDGILNVELMEEMRKKKHLAWYWTWFALIRDFFLVPLISGATELNKRSIEAR